MRNPRVLIAAGVVFAALVVGVVVLPLVTGGSSEEDDDPPRLVRAKLTLERFVPSGATPELLVSLSVPRLNTLSVNNGERLVWLRCFDASGAVVIRRAADWPLLEEVGYLPHIHQPANPRLLGEIRGCRLTGRGIALEGRVPGRLPAASGPG